jgi:probable rRNA maturation factor
VSNIPDNNRPDDHRPENHHRVEDSLRIELIIDHNVTSPLDEARVAQAARCAAAHRGYHCGEIGIRVTSDAIIQQINRQHLGHDYPTDVISFNYLAEQPKIEGELVVSADTARRCAVELGWPSRNEFILYVVHGTLHITGLDDQNAGERAKMRQAEQEIMMQLGIDDIVRFGADRAGASVPEGHRWEGQS